MMASVDVQPAAPAANLDLPDYLTDPDAVLKDHQAKWRYGRAPDYSKTRKVYQDTKKMSHTAGSLPQLVENLVKNWEVEASFKTNLPDWRTIDPDNYSFAVNASEAQTAEHMLKVGTYNALISPTEYYSPEYSDFASSHKTFKRMMPNFAWEVVEVYSGPPQVAFRWRHWGVMKNDYVGFNNKGEKVTAKAHGGPIDIEGVTVATVDDKVRLQHVRTWFDPMDMFRQIDPQGLVIKQPVFQRLNPSEALDETPKVRAVPNVEAHGNTRTTSTETPSDLKPTEIDHNHVGQNGTRLSDRLPAPDRDSAITVSLAACPFTNATVERNTPKNINDRTTNPQSESIDDATITAVTDRQTFEINPERSHMDPAISLNLNLTMRPVSESSASLSHSPTSGSTSQTEASAVSLADRHPVYPSINVNDDVASESTEQAQQTRQGKADTTDSRPAVERDDVDPQFEHDPDNH